jgi:hypothetical protein
MPGRHRAIGLELEELRVVVHADISTGTSGIVSSDNEAAWSAESGQPCDAPKRLYCVALTSRAPEARSGVRVAKTWKRFPPMEARYWIARASCVVGSSSYRSQRLVLASAHTLEHNRARAEAGFVVQ